MAIILGIRRVNAYTPAKYWCLYKNSILGILLFSSLGKTSCVRVRVYEEDVPLNE